jgi:hypothetical protein
MIHIHFHLYAVVVDIFDEDIDEEEDDDGEDADDVHSMNYNVHLFDYYNFVLIHNVVVDNDIVKMDVNVHVEVVVAYVEYFFDFEFVDVY